ncbi:hypothetical protein AKJ65_06425 [candidate division MSBL1 archaeon SCGC-AAA259E19]|uniref:Uncharacterized protein n=1 Tax=candidate division MSBL1 archaeon SCGC-AAA259E19 TaxID=1698264 RepID=A0A133UGG9_9EURY|nr:hypothetical protein AKJ65_06425 [candidate division MSBL1 archaeon SCGC-AAA259E19]
MTTIRKFIEDLRENPGFLLIDMGSRIVEVRGEEGELVLHNEKGETIRETDEEETNQLMKVFDS